MNNDVDIEELKAEIMRLRIELVNVRKQITVPKCKLKEYLNKTKKELERLIDELNHI